MAGKIPKVLAGCDDFKRLVIESDLFVDKSLFIQEIIDSPDLATLLIKPRRWGKSLALDMLADFLALEVDECGLPIFNQNKILFEGGVVEVPFVGSKNLTKLKIAEIENGDYLRFQGKYPVIHFTMKDVVGNSMEEIVEKMRYMVRKIFEHYSYLAASNYVLPSQKKEFLHYLQNEASVPQLETSIKLLTQLLHRHHGTRVYVLVDEYDKTVSDLLERDFTANSQLLKDAMRLLTNFFSQCGKSNPYLEKMVMSGIFDTLKRDGNSGLNNLKIYDLESPQFSQYFGFSDEEVSMLVKAFGFGKEEGLIREVISDWYNGYMVPGVNNTRLQVYTPWAVVNYLNRAAKTSDFRGEGYWVKSGAAMVFQNMLRVGRVSPDMLIKLKTLINGGQVEMSFAKHSLSDYNIDTADYSDEFAVQLLFHSGYLTMNSHDGKYIFSIPNFEVIQEFKDTIEARINSVTKFVDRTSDNEQVKINAKLLSTLYEMLDRSLVNEEMKRAFKAVQDHDSETFISVTRLIPVCKNEVLNLFHLAVISDNLANLRAVYSNCNNKLLNEPDHRYGLTALDYAVLLERTEMITVLKNNGAIAAVPQPISIVKETVCSFLDNGWTIAGVGFTACGVADYYYGKYVGRNGAIATIGSVAAYNIASWFKPSHISYCKEYHEVKDQVQPQSGLSNMLLKLYHYNKHAYVTIDNKCNSHSSPQQQATLRLDVDELVEGSSATNFTLCVENHLLQQENNVLLGGEEQNNNQEWEM